MVTYRWKQAALRPEQTVETDGEGFIVSTASTSKRVNFADIESARFFYEPLPLVTNAQLQVRVQSKRYVLRFGAFGAGDAQLADFACAVSKILWGYAKVRPGADIALGLSSRSEIGVYAVCGVVLLAAFAFIFWGRVESDPGMIVAVGLAFATTFSFVWLVRPGQNRRKSISVEELALQLSKTAENPLQAPEPTG